MEVESATNGRSSSINDLLLRSKKRTLDLFIGNNFNVCNSTVQTLVPEDAASLRVKLTTKVSDEYSLVKDMPPPTATKPKSREIVKAPTEPSQSATAPTAISSNKRGSSILLSQPAETKEKIRILGTHAHPSRPGVSVSDAEAALEEEEEEIVEESSIQQVIKSIPSSGKAEAQVSSSLIQYTQAAGRPDLHEPPSKTRALALRNPYAAVKPEWHAPWKLARVISGHLGWVRSVCVDPTNEWFATGSADRTIKIWDLASGQLKLTLTGHINAVRGLVVSDRHPYLFSVAEDKMIKCWDLESNKVIRHYHGHLSAVYSVALHPTLDILVTGGRDSSVRVWDIRTKAAIHVLTGHTSTVATVAAQGTEPQIISGSHDSTIRLWDLVKGESRTTLTHHKKSVRSIVLHPEEYSMASASPDNIKHWKFPEGQFLKNFGGHNAIINSLAVNRDNVLVSCADNGSMYFWDWKTGYNFQRVQTVVQSGSLESEAGIYCSTFDVTGSRLIVGEADKTIKIYKEDEDATEETHPMDDWKTQQATAKKY